MKKLLQISVLSLFAVLASCTGSGTTRTEDDTIITHNNSDMNNVSAEDLAGISKALDLYVNAAIEGDSNVARPAFAEGATISHIENDSLICLPIQALYDYYDQTGKHPASYEIADCNIANDVATVRIESVFGDAKFTDMFALAKTADGWQIVSKVFTLK